MTELVNAYLGQARELVQVGGPAQMGLIDDLLPDLVTVRRVDDDDDEAVRRAAADPETLLAVHLSPEVGLSEALVDKLASRPEGARTLLLSPEAVRILSVDQLADGLSRAGHRCVHVVAVSVDSRTFWSSVVGAVAVGADAVKQDDNHAVLATAVSAANSSAVSLDAIDALEAALVAAVGRAAVESHARNTAEAELADARRELADARRELRALRTSAAMQIGRGVVDLVQHPVSGARLLPGRLRAAKRVRGSAQRSIAAASGPPASASPALPPGATSSGRVLPIPTGRRRTFVLALPSCDSTVSSPHASTTPRTHVDIDVPYPFYIPSRLQRDGLAGYEPETLAWWLALCDLAGEGEVWDIGANTSLFAMLARALTDRDVVAFEPTPDLAEWSRRIGFVNDLAFSVEQLAIADADGTATFFLSDSTDSSSSLAEGFRESTRHLDVLTERLDSFAVRRGRPPAVIKIDVETTEPAVLRGGLKTIEEHRPWILCEVLAGCGVEQPVMEMTKGLGYSWYHLTEEMPPRRVDEIVGDPSFVYFMYLLAPREIDDALVDRARGWRSGLAQCLPLSPPT